MGATGAAIATPDRHATAAIVDVYAGASTVVIGCVSTAKTGAPNNGVTRYVDITGVS